MSGTATNRLARQMLDDWAAIDLAELAPDLLAALRALAYHMRLAVDHEWDRRDLAQIAAGPETADVQGHRKGGS